MRTINKIFLTCIFIYFIVFIIIIIISKNNNNHNLKPVSLPEEISEAKQGDKLKVISISDSIYIGFDNSKKLLK
jgi:hypothetical protein